MLKQLLLGIKGSWCWAYSTAYDMNSLTKSSRVPVSTCSKGILITLPHSKDLGISIERFIHETEHLLLRQCRTPSHYCSEPKS